LIMIETLIEVDVSKPAEEQADVIHYRWHPDIPMTRVVKPGAEFRIQCLDWTGGQISNDDSAADIRDVDLAAPAARPEQPPLAAPGADTAIRRPH
jgi:formamidase